MRDIADVAITATQRLAELLLGQPVNDWITSKRGQGLTWRRIAADLSEATGGEVAVSHEAVRLWHEDAAA